MYSTMKQRHCTSQSLDLVWKKLHLTQQKHNNRFTALCLGYPGEPVPEETLTHPPPDQHPIFISLFRLPRAIASSLFKLHAWQSFSTTSRHPLWSISWSGVLHLIFHTFLHPVSSFHGTCPYHHNLFWCNINIISSIPGLSLNSLLGTLFLAKVNSVQRRKVWLTPTTRCHAVTLPRRKTR